METHSCTRSTTATSTGWPIAGRLIDAITRRDFADLASCLAPDVRLRAVIPPGFVEVESAQEVAARFGQWFGGPDGFEVLDASAGLIGPRQYVRWRIRMWPQDRPGDARIVEQHAFTRGFELLESLDLLCSGFHAESP